MADQITFNPLRAVDWNGESVPGAEARFFLSGTTTAATVYADSSLTTPHPTPLLADARGNFAQVFPISGQLLKVEVRDPGLTMLPGFPIDPAPVAQVGGSAATAVGFNPTAEIPVTNVQAAIEQVQANITVPTLQYGLGATGSIVVLANIDATNTASGTYRVDATTTGTLPAGFAVAAGGIVEFRRETVALASMTLHHGGTDRQSTRKMVAGVWGAWREELTANQTLVAGDTFYHDGTSLVRLPKGTAGQVLQINSGATAPEWATPPRIVAWVKFNGTGTPAVIAGYNVASITDLGTGSYRVNFTTAMASTGYAVTVSMDDSFSRLGTMTTTYCEVLGTDGNFAARDSDFVHVVVVM